VLTSVQQGREQKRLPVNHLPGGCTGEAREREREMEGEKTEGRTNKCPIDVQVNSPQVLSRKRKKKGSKTTKSKKTKKKKE